MKLLLVLYFIVAAKAIPTAEWSGIRSIRARKPIFNLMNLSDDTRIVGGTEVERGSFPFQAGISIETRWFCGGSLISDTFVLTAAHCAAEFNHFEVFLGTHDIRAVIEDGRFVTTTTIKIVHENFSPVWFTNDIALLKLRNPVSFTDLIKPVRLPSRSQIGESFAGQIANVSGWGLTSEVGNQSSVLLYTEVPIMNNEDCQRVYLPGLIHDQMLCVDTKGGQHGPCNGDSGGALVITEEDGKYTEVGIVSWGADAGCDGGYPEIFVRLTFFLDWIQDSGGPLIRP